MTGVGRISGRRPENAGQAPWGVQDEPPQNSGQSHGKSLSGMLCCHRPDAGSRHTEPDEAAAQVDQIGAANRLYFYAPADLTAKFMVTLHRVGAQPDAFGVPVTGFEQVTGSFGADRHVRGPSEGLENTDVVHERGDPQQLSIGSRCEQHGQFVHAFAMALKRCVDGTGAFAKRL